MSAEWEETTLADVSSEVSYGYTESASDKKVGPRFLRITDIQNGVVNWSNVPYCPISKADHGKYRLQSGDIVVARTGNSTGENFLYQGIEDAVFASYLIRFRINPEEADPTFIWYNLRSKRWWNFINSSKTGSAQPCANAKVLGQFSVSLPSLTEQKSIAQILASLDDKIELNRRMNETLEALVQSLFKSWFVDFDAVRADGGHFQDSAIGPIPKGWKVERFDKHISADRGLSYKGDGLRDDGTGLPMHNLNSVYEGGGYKHEGIKYYAGEYGERHLLQPGDMIVTNTEQGFDHLLIGHAAIVPKRYGTKGLFSHHIYRVRHKPTSPFSPHYLVELFNNRRWHYWISGFSNGTTINMLPKDALEMPLLVVPPDELVKKFTALAEAVHTKIEANLEESRMLAALRDALLPKLLSGELRVPIKN